jgi:hypothetical protein
VRTLIDQLSRLRPPAARGAWLSILAVAVRQLGETLFQGATDVKFLMFIKHPESDRSQPIPPGLMDAMGEFVTANLKSGVLLDTAGLKPTSEGFRVRLAGGRIGVTDGPFTETKEVIGGYALVQAKTRDEALNVARKFMDLHRVHWPAFEGECEVRPLEDL